MADSAERMAGDLGRKVVSAFGWTAAIKLAFQAVTWALTLVVIRVLSPNDYGLMALSQVFVNFMMGFVDLGLGDALVQRDVVSRPLVRSVFGVLIILSCLLTVALWLAAYPIARWYHDPRLLPLIQVASLGFILNGLMVLPRTFLTKSLRVRPMFVMELSSGLGGAAVVIVLAFTGHGVWALMLGWLAATALKLVGYAALLHEYYVWPSFNFGIVRPLLPFGLYRTLDFTVWAAFMSADVLIVGRLLGAVQLGIYAVALNFAAMPLSKIAPIVNSIAFPAFAMVKSQPAHARFYAMKSLRLMAAITVPIFFGISAVAPEIVDVVFGPKWTAAKPVLAVLVLAISFRAVLLVIPNFLQGIGDARAGFWCTAAGAVIFPPLFVIGCRWGLMGVCWAWVGGYPVVFAIAGLIAGRRGGLEIRALLLTPLRPMVAGAIMIAVLTLLRPAIPPTLAEPWRLAALVAAGALTYWLVMFVAFRDLLMEVLRLARGSRPALP